MGTTTRKIKLTQGKFAIVDSRDFSWLNKVKWFYHKEGYAINRSGRMHRLIIKAKIGEICDHVNRNKLDNRRKNLRICTKSQNAINSPKPKRNISGFKGVSWNTRRQQWIAVIYKDRKSFFLGGFANKKDAAMAYNKAAESLFGKFAYLNKI